jgi:NAD(P)-dependent dehydrogenase (short-subunit alcohol dehydrogenase family)
VDLGLAGSVALVTGASKGIGLAISRALVAEGAHVVAGAREPSEELTALVDEGLADFVEVDLASPGGPADLVAGALARHQRLDVLVNNVGGAATRTGGFLSVTDDEWLFSITLNLMAAVRTTRAALVPMLDSGKGSIVTTSSVNAFLPDPNVIDYSAAKAALSNFCKSLSKEVAPHGVRVNTISPGPVATDLWLGAGGVAATVARATGADPEDVAAGAAAQSVTGRFTTPEEVGHLVAFLAGSAASNITGADFTIDGGLVTTL